MRLCVLGAPSPEMCCFPRVLTDRGGDDHDDTGFIIEGTHPGADISKLALTQFVDHALGARLRGLLDEDVPRIGQLHPRLRGCEPCLIKALDALLEPHDSFVVPVANDFLKAPCDVR